MREIRFTKTFLRNWRALHRARLVGYDDLDTVVYLLEKGEPLPLDFDDHALTDNYEGYRNFIFQAMWLSFTRHLYDV